MPSNLPPGCRETDVEGEPCPECGRRGCECEAPAWDDPTPYKERLEEMKADDREDE